MRSWMSATNSLAFVVITAKVQIFPVLPNAADTERTAIFHDDRVRLFRFLALDHLPREEAIDRDNAASPMIGVPEGGQGVHGLAFGVDRLAPAFRVLAPIGNKTPAQGVERQFAGLMIAPDHQQLLAGRGIPPGRIIVYSAIERVHTIDNGNAGVRCSG